MTRPAPRFSLVIPCYNEEARIEASMRRVGEFLSRQDFTSEVVLVDDGSGTAGCAAAITALELLPPPVGRVFLRHDSNRGKGAAVCTGMLAANGELAAFIDADLATPPEDVLGLLAALDAGADVAIGVRNQADGSDMRDRRSPARRLAGKLYAWLMKTWLLPGFEDSQCPLKAFRGDAARRLFRLQRVQTWAFDAEVLFLAEKLGLEVARVPVRWQAVAGSHLNLLKSALEVWNLLRIRIVHRGVNRSTPGPERPEPASAQ